MLPPDDFGAFAFAFSKKFAVDHLGLELELFVDLDDEHLVEVATTLDVRGLAQLLGGDRLDLDPVIAHTAIGAPSSGAVPNDAVLDLGIQLAELAPYLKVASGRLFVRRSEIYQVVEDLDDFQVGLGEFLAKLLIRELTIDPVPADPLAVVVYPVRCISERPPCHRAFHAVLPATPSRRPGRICSLF